MKIEELQNAIIKGDANQLSVLLSTATPGEKENALIWALAKLASLYGRENIANMLEEKLPLSQSPSSPPPSLYPSLDSLSSYPIETTSPLSMLVSYENNQQQQRKRPRDDKNTDAANADEPLEPLTKKQRQPDDKSENKPPEEKKSDCRIM